VPRVGLEQLQKIRGKTATFRKSDVPYRIVTTKIRRFGRSKTGLQNQQSLDPNLEKIISAWKKLPEKIRKAILVMADV
jgi:hypothetical protein